MGNSFDISGSKTLKYLRDAELKAKAERPGNEAFSVSRKKAWLFRFLLVSSGFLFAAAYPPLNWHILGWIGLIPFYFLVKDRRPRQAWRYGFLWGYAWACAAFFWLREIEFFLPFLMAAVLALFPAFWAISIPLLRRYIFIPADIQLRGYEEETKFDNKNLVKECIFVLILACWWCVLEWIRTWIATGLPWNFLAVTQWKNSALLQICEYTGVYGLSFILVFFNIALAFALGSWIRGYKDGKYRRPIPFFVSLLLIMVSVIVGSASMLKYREEGGMEFKVALIQGDIPQCRIATDEQAKFALEEYLKFSELAVIMNPDIVIWPETAVPTPYHSACDFGEEYRYRLAGIILRSRIPFLIGTIDFGDVRGIKDPREIPIHNSAILLNSESQVVDRYHKIHLVPFGEYTPLGKYYPCLIKMFGMGRDLAPGNRHTVFELKAGVRAAVNICYEDIFPYLSREHTLAGANLLVVLTNDAWYPKSSEAEQHLANAVFRAVENRRTMLRSGNNCCSCVILPTGVVSDSISVEYDAKLKKMIPVPEKKVQGYANFNIRISPSPPLTFYTRYGDVFILFCGIICLFAALYVLWTWREKKEKLMAAFEIRGHTPAIDNK